MSMFCIILIIEWRFRKNDDFRLNLCVKRMAYRTIEHLQLVGLL